MINSQPQRGMAVSFAVRAGLIVLVFWACAVALYAHPETDLAVAARFYEGQTFVGLQGGLYGLVHDLVRPLSFAVAALTLGGLLVALAKKICLGLAPRAWLFLLLTLVVGPGLVTNVLLKDHWGRARPLQVEQFGGPLAFSPPLVIAHQCDHNCAFVSGDAAFGFWLHSLAYVAPRRRRVLLWSGLAAGAGLGFVRIAMGAHFLSDVFFAGVFMLLSSAAVYALCYGRAALAARAREWLGPAGVSPAAS